MSVETYFENPASRTLLVPLVVRVQESAMTKGLFIDVAAQAVAAKLPQEQLNFHMNAFIRIGTAVRIHYFDELACEFIRQHERPVIVQLGCGLDTRAYRLDSGKEHYVHIDLPDVMALRKELLPPLCDRFSDWAYSILDFQWMDRLLAEFSGSDFMFIAEGVLMYLEKDGVESFFQEIGNRFPGCHIVFDTTGSRVARMINKRTIIGQMGARMPWPYDDDGSLEEWQPALRRLSKQYYFNLYKERWGLWHFVQYVPWWGRQSVMYHYMVTA